MAAAPGPTVVDVQYHNNFGIHIARLHTREWSGVSSGHDLGEVPRWSDDTLIDLEDMVTELVTDIATGFDSTTHFDIATVFTQATPTSLLVPQASKSLCLTGTWAGDPSWTKGAQLSNVWRATDGSIAKIVMLDAESENDWDAVRAVPGTGPLHDIHGDFTVITNAWCSSGGARPNTFLGQFKTLNEALRKHYRMN